MVVQGCLVFITPRQSSPLIQSPGPSIIPITRPAFNSLQVASSPISRHHDEHLCRATYQLLPVGSFRTVSLTMYLVEFLVFWDAETLDSAKTTKLGQKERTSHP